MLVTAAGLPDELTKISKVWYTQDNYASSTKGGLSREQLAKEKERDEIIERMMKQLNLITQYVARAQWVDIVQAIDIFPFEYEPSENDHEKEVCFIANQVLGWNDPKSARQCA